MRYVTTELLKEISACPSSIRRFNRVFPSGKARITLKNLNLWIKNSTNLDSFDLYILCYDALDITDHKINKHRTIFLDCNHTKSEIDKDMVKAFWQVYKEKYLKRRKTQ